MLLVRACATAVGCRCDDVCVAAAVDADVVAVIMCVLRLQLMLCVLLLPFLWLADDDVWAAAAAIGAPGLK